MSIGTVENHRKREEGVLVYPVYSRRSGGLSVGINLFPDSKICSFDCPYCEVFPFSAGADFTLPRLETELEAALADARKRNIPVRDICFSGNGEPTQSPHFPAALEKAFRLRDREATEAELVLITNGTGLLREECFELLRGAACGDHAAENVQDKDRALRIWLKLDAGTPAWYRAMNRSSVSFELLLEKILAFVKCAPVILQTMICTIDGKAPPAEEAQAWETLVLKLAHAAPRNSAFGLRTVQIYGKARSAPEDPLAAALPETFLQVRAASLRSTLNSAGVDIPVFVYP